MAKKKKLKEKLQQQHGVYLKSKDEDTTIDEIIDEADVSRGFITISMGKMIF